MRHTDHIMFLRHTFTAATIISSFFAHRPFLCVKFESLSRMSSTSTLTTISSGLSTASKIFSGILARILFGWNPAAFQGEVTISSIGSSSLPTFLSDTTLLPLLQNQVFTQDVKDKLSDESLVKICRQLEFWYTTAAASDDEENLKNHPAQMVEYAKSLVRQATWYIEDVVSSNTPETKLSSLMQNSKVPHVRFGKTEVQIPIVTCGGMRLQHTWCPDNIPIAPSKKDILSSPTQPNLKRCIRSCLALGINHFETARMYGTSEFQFVQALHELIQEGEIQRSDFILQTKLVQTPTKEAFEKLWEASWKNIGDKLGYVDLFAMHAISFVNDELMACLDFCDELKKKGLIRHIGFSTHATSGQIMNLINTERVSFTCVECMID